jgi:hypothetical protein
MSTQTTDRRTSVMRTSWGFLANSVLAAVLAVVLTRLIEQFGVALAGVLFDRQPVMTNIFTEFRAPGNDLAYLGGTVTALVTGIVFLILFPGARDRSAGKLTVLWMSLFSFRIAFYDMIQYRYVEDSPLSKALAGVDIPAGIDTILAAAGAVGMLLISIAAAAAFLGFNRHRSEVATPKERMRFAASIALIPGLVAPLLSVPFFLPDAGSGYVASLPLIGLFSIVTTMAARNTTNISIPLAIEERSFSIGLAVAAVIVFVVARFLAPGVPIPPWDASLNLQFRP